MQNTRGATIGAMVGFIVVGLAPTVLASPRFKTSRGWVAGWIPPPIFKTTTFRLKGHFALVVKWRVTTLLKEPVVTCNAGWVIAGVDSAGGVLAEPLAPGQTVGGPGSERKVPRSVLERLRLINVRIVGTLLDSRAPVSLDLPCDVGVMRKPGFYRGGGGSSLNPILRKVRRWRRSRLSYNVSGSPPWTRLFRTSDGGFAAAPDAKRVMRGRFKLALNGVTNQAISAEVDLSPVADWLAEIEKKKKKVAKKKLDTIEKQKKDRQDKRDTATGKEFWDGPENADTTADRESRENTARDLQTLAKRSTKLAEQAERARSRYDTWLARTKDGWAALKGLKKNHKRYIGLPSGTLVRNREEGQGVAIERFTIAKSEVTLRDYGACVRAGGCTAPASGRSCNWGRPARDQHPINCVSWKQAHEFCQFVRARLPSSDQWLYAARAGGWSIAYPWGNDKPSCSRAAMSGCQRGTDTVCAKRAGNTKQGLCNMAANVSEWTRDCAKAQEEECTARRVMGASYTGRYGRSCRQVRRFCLSSYRIATKNHPGGRVKGKCPDRTECFDSDEVRANRMQTTKPGSQAPTIGFRCAR